MMGFGLFVPILLVVVLAYVFGWIPQGREGNPLPVKRNRGTSTALEVLEERYARGEISREEYLEIRDDLTL